MKILGSPFGSTAYMSTFGATLTEATTKLLDYLPKLSSLQASWLLLYFCAVPRMNHILCTTPPTLARSLAETHDAACSRTFLSIFSMPLAHP